MRVIVTDDDVLLRAGLASLLERSGFAVAGQAGDAEELLGLVRTRAPDLIVDIRIPPTHTEEGLEAVRAEGRSNTGIARQLWVTEGTVEKHVHSILTKLALPQTDDDHRGCSPVTVASRPRAWVGRFVHALRPPFQPATTSCSAFTGFQFAPDVIVLAVRWYLRFGLSYATWRSCSPSAASRSTT